MGRRPHRGAVTLHPLSSPEVSQGPQPTTWANTLPRGFISTPGEGLTLSRCAEYRGNIGAEEVFGALSVRRGPRGADSAASGADSGACPGPASGWPCPGPASGWPWPGPASGWPWPGPASGWPCSCQGEEWARLEVSWGGLQGPWLHEGGGGSDGLTAVCSQDGCWAWRKWSEPSLPAT